MSFSQDISNSNKDTCTGNSELDSSGLREAEFGCEWLLNWLSETGPWWQTRPGLVGGEWLVLGVSPVTPWMLLLPPGAPPRLPLVGGECVWKSGRCHGWLEPADPELAWP